MPPHERHLIDQAWTFKALSHPFADASVLRPVAQFPTNIHLDLLFHHRIPDPFIGLNEDDESVRAVGDDTWVYHTTFPTPASLSVRGEDGRLVRHSLQAELVFEGLDTIATVELNGERILDANNMFLEYRVTVTDLLRRPCLGDSVDDTDTDTCSSSGHDSDTYMVVDPPASNDDDYDIADDKAVNELVITFKSARKYGREQQLKNHEHQWVCSNGTSERLAVRKAQYHWGWDWGPTLLTCGPWKPIALGVFSARIEDLHAAPLFPNEGILNCRARFDALGALTVHIGCVVSGALGAVAKVNFKLVGPDGTDCIQDTQPGGGKAPNTLMAIPNPKLWYPRRHGPQNMYTLTATLLDHSGNTLDKTTKRVAFRCVRLVQDVAVGHTPGHTFTIEVNGAPIFCGGSNWIPADSFLPRITPQTYRDWIQLAVAGNQDMLRVWGGGIYEHDAFYDACDDAGILVWQDFMFACGNYPATPEFLDLVRQEAEQNVRRLRRHPCIVLWVGNNEDYQIAEQNGDLGYDPEDTKDPTKWLQTKFPARYTYEVLLRGVCQSLVPSVPYRPGSPWGGTTCNDPSEGDIHQWNVWHGAQRPYQDYGKLVGRFVSEFGMQAFPAVQTTESYLPDPDSVVQRSPGSAIVDFHNKAGGQARRLGMYLLENLGYVGETLEDATYATQLLQAEAVGCAVRAWRGDGWRGDPTTRTKGRQCGGALVWQLNDCWPCTSWAVCDYALRPKGAYFAMKRELADVALQVKRYHVDTSEGEPPAETGYAISASNLTLEEKKVVLVFKACEADTGKDVMAALRGIGGNDVSLAEENPCWAFVLPPNSGIELCRYIYREGAQDVDRHVVWATLTDASSNSSSTPIARHVSWPDPLKHVPFTEEPIVVGPIVDVHAETIRLKASAPLKGVLIEVVHAGDDGDDGYDSDDDYDSDNNDYDGDDDGDDGDDAGAVELGDNLVDLVPGEWFTIAAKGVEENTRFKLMWFGAGGVQTFWSDLD